MKKKRVVVAMSGGVDSSVSALLLKKQGYEVIGITMKLPHVGEKNEYGCCGWKGIDDARTVAGKLDIRYHVLDFEKEFKENVINYFCSEYLRGRTPNPCAVCNEKMKFGLLLKKARELDADFISTGHYARIEKEKNSGRYLLKKARDKTKDQSYFLFSLTQEQLSLILFPLGDYTKNEARQAAKEAGLDIHDKPGSQEVCFIPDNDYRRFLREHVKPGEFKPGKILTGDGKVTGNHGGIAFYTIGQRKGIGSHKKPNYVISLERDKNAIIIGEENKLYRDNLVAADVNLVSMEALQGALEVSARIRYRAPEANALVIPMSGNKVEVRFSQPQRAVTPGQAVVFYEGDTLVGGGWID